MNETDTAATLAHMVLLKRKQARLREVHLDAEIQVLTAISAAYAGGDMSVWDLADLHTDFAAAAAPGYRKRWNAAIPVSAELLTRRSKNRPNGPHGSWQGTFPITDPPAPSAGMDVVYVLYDHANVPCYVGSTDNFRVRLARHGRDKRFATWTAFPCPDREAAYQLEERLLAEHMPYLNKKRGR